MRFLVTGGAGFIGSHTVQALLEEGGEVTVLDNFETGHREYVSSGVRLVEGDITDEEVTDAAVKGADYVIHSAAFVSVPDSMERPQRCFAVNDLGLLNLLNSVRRHGVKKIVFCGSSAIYGENPPGPKAEDTVPQPQSPYAVTKLDGEYLLEIFAEQQGKPYVALRYFNVFGPRQPADSAYAAVIPAFIHAALRSEDLVIYGDGSQTRDFVYVQDVVRANLQALKRGRGVYNIGTGTAISILDLARRIIALTGANSRIVFDQPRPGDILHSISDISRARGELGWEPRWSLEDGLIETIAAFRHSA